MAMGFNRRKMQVSGSLDRHRDAVIAALMAVR
jgi:hypothetical protein